eukprot:PhM_4_TR7571/c0_g1_i1/m.20488
MNESDAIQIPGVALTVSGDELAYKLYDASKDDKAKVTAAADKFSRIFTGQLSTDVVAGTVFLPQTDVETVIKCSDDPSCVIPIPCTLDDDMLAQLYYTMPESRHGKEGCDGDVLDTSVRSSRELPAVDSAASHTVGGPHVVLPPTLATFAFDSARAVIGERLGAAWTSVRIEPYRFIVYAEGDFFDTHVDSVDHPDHFGTIALHIPLASQLAKAGDIPEDDGSDNVCEGKGWMDPKTFEAMTSVRNTWLGEAERDGGGELLFMFGRNVSSCGNKDVTMVGSGLDVFGPEYPEHEHVGVVRFDEYSSAEVKDGLPTKRIAFANDLIHNPARHGSASQKSEGTPLHYAAWHTHVPHRVMPLDSDYRIVVTYKVYHEGFYRPISIPRAVWAEADAALANLETVLDAVSPADPAKANTFGVLLRNAYPAAGLRPSVLKGVDAYLWNYLSFKRRCYLIPVLDCRVDYPSVPHRSLVTDERYVFVLTEESPRPPSNGFTEQGQEDMAKTNPFVACRAWLPLGSGDVLGGGCVYGNADCGSDWWYQRVAIVVTSNTVPLSWERKRQGFLALWRSTLPTMKRLGDVRDVSERVISYL